MIGAYGTRSLTLRRLVSLDQWNTAVYTDIAFMGFMENGSKLVRNAQGEQVVSMARVGIPASVGSVTLADRIIDDEGAEHSIIALDPKYDFSFSHWEAALS